MNNTRTLVLMHGLGSDERDMQGIAPLLFPEVQTVCLRAPFSYGPGYAWFTIDWTQDGIVVHEEEFWSSVDLVAEALPKIGENLIVGGFSQGAMMTVGLMHKYPHLVGDAVLLSGRGAAFAPTEFPGRVFQAHGYGDEVIPYQDAIALRDSLAPLGDRYEFHGYQMGHTLCQEEVNDLKVWLKKVSR